MKTFIKNNPTTDPNTLVIEAKGLNLLREACKDLDIHIPKVINVDEKVLELEFIDSYRATDKQLRLLGEELAKLHLKEFADYGLDYDNYIGLNPQKNELYPSWGDFFIEYRLEFQIGLIKDKKVKSWFYQKLDASKDALIPFLNCECDHPSLLHGDLWSGNFLTSEDAVWLIDPAVYYGDREADLAMTEMFGGFGRAFYEAYDSVYPRSPAYDLKKDLFNLYHYLNHYNLFGDSYLTSCKNLCVRFSEV